MLAEKGGELIELRNVGSVEQKTPEKLKVKTECMCVY
jgi:hypothetical protein